MVKLHLELEGEVVRVLRRIGGGDNEGGEVQDGPRPASTEERTSAVGTVPERGTTATSATLVPGHWTQELAADFTAGLNVVSDQMLRNVWRADAAGIHRSALCQRTDLAPAGLRSLLMRMGHVLRRFQRERGMALSGWWGPTPVAELLRRSRLRGGGVRHVRREYAGPAVQWLEAPLTTACHTAPGRTNCA